MKKLMKAAIILLSAIIMGGWSFFSPGTLLVTILSSIALYLFSLSIKEKKQKKAIIGICAFALALRFILSIFNYYASWALGVGADFIGDARAYSAAGQYIAEVITQKPASNFDNNEIEEVPCLREKYKGQIPIRGYRVDTFGRYTGLIYSIFGYNPVMIKLINSLLSVLAGIFLFILARKVFSARTASIVLGLALFWPSTIMWSVTGIKESLLIFLIAFNILVYLCYLKDNINNWEFVILFLVFAIRNYFLFALFIFIFGLFHFFNENKPRRSVFNTIIKPLVLVLAMKISFAFIGAVRIHLSFILLFVFLLSRVTANRKSFAFLFILAFLGGLYIFMAKVDIKKFYNYATYEFIYQQRNQLYSANTAYKVYPDKYYSLQSSIPFHHLVFSYVKGLGYTVFSPFPFSKSREIFGFLGSIQMIFFYVLFPFIGLGIFISLRYKWRDMSIIIFFMAVTLSLYALIEGNVGTLFRHRDVAAIFFLVFSAVGIDRLLGTQDRVITV